MNCKKGDMAYLSGECIDSGKVVEVLSAFPVGPDELPAWNCRSKSPMHCAVPATGITGMHRIFVVQDRYLRPIGGVPVSTEMADEVTA